MSQEADTSCCGPPMVDPKVPLDDLYKYEPLMLETHIRLLILNSGTGEDLLAGSIKMVDLDDPELDSFEAISYVWGSNEKDQAILIDGRPLPITTNLREALFQTRLPERPRILWADSICINQDDSVEKGHQVFAMGRIYNTSRRTLICLGRQRDDEHKGRDAVALINDVEAMIDAVMLDPHFSGGYNSFPWPSEDDPLVVDTRWLSAWNTLVGHDWFIRGWVVQETALGHDALIHWAGAHIEWMSLLRVECWLYWRAFPVWRPGRRRPCHLSPLHSDSFHLRRGEETRTYVPRCLYENARAVTILSVLSSARFLQLTDPRDRIYAFMALETTDGIMAKLKLQPDYEQTHHEVFYEFARRYVQETSDLDILTHVDHDEDSIIGHHDLPSWVPRWDIRTNTYCFHIHRSDCKQSCLGDHKLNTTDILQESELRLRGVLIGRVHYTSRKIVKNYEDPIEEVLTLWWEVVAELKKQPGPSRETLSFALLDAISLGQSVGEVESWIEAKNEFARCLDLNNDKDELRKITRDPPMYGKAHRISHFAVGVSENRRVVALEPGFIGVTSAGARPGDLCAFISGLCAPLILRPVIARPNHYNLVGNAYFVTRTVVWGGRLYCLGSESPDKAWIKEYLPAQEIIIE